MSSSRTKLHRASSCVDDCGIVDSLLIYASSLWQTWHPCFSWQQSYPGTGAPVADAQGPQLLQACLAVAAHSWHFFTKNIFSPRGRRPGRRRPGPTAWPAAAAAPPDRRPRRGTPSPAAACWRSTRRATARHAPRRPHTAGISKGRRFNGFYASRELHCCRAKCNPHCRPSPAEMVSAASSNEQ